MVIIHTGTGLSLRSAKSPPPPPPNPSIHSSHPLLWHYLALYLSTHHPEIPLFLFFLPFISFLHPCFSLVSFSVSLLSFHPSVYFPPFFSPLSVSVPPSPSVLSTSTLEDTLFCKSNKPARVLHLMDAHTHSDRLNAG